MTLRKLRIGCAAAAMMACAPAAAETVVVTADRMIDVLAGRVVERPVIVIADGRIVAVGTAGAQQPSIRADWKRIDLPGKTILPGLIDMHVHLDANPTYGGYTGLQFTDQFWTVQGTANAKAMLEAGFTPVALSG